MAARPTVNVRGVDGKAAGSTPLPAVFTAPIRTDVVEAIHKSMAKNKRQPYAVYNEAGKQHSAHSFGTGRAIARLPRISGSGTHRAGQGAGSNAARGSYMYSPTRIWRRWFVKINQAQRRYATASALAATAVPSLLLARGHRVEGLEEVPVVVNDSVQSFTKTKEAIALLQAVQAYDDVIKVANSRKVRAGVGKARNRRHVQRRGPLIVYNEDQGVVKAFRNLPGVEIVSVHRLNLLQLAPGGHVGRFCIWTESAFKALDTIFGTYDKPSEVKKGFSLPSAKISQTDVTRIINSSEIQSVLRAAKSGPTTKRPFTQKKNPLVNRGVLFRLNPYAQTAIRAAIREQKQHIDGKKKTNKSEKKLSANEAFLEQLHAP